MTDDIHSRVLQAFERRLEADSEVSPVTREVLLEGQRKNDFGDDDELLDELRDRFGDE